VSVLRKSNERGQADFGWLKAKHTFSFGHYFNPEFMGFGDLRVLNEDRIAGNSGFAEHSHKDMEIVTVMLSGQLEHTDSMGNKIIINPGEIQRMSAGSGIRHSEMNPIDEETHLLQVWIQTAKNGIEPSYEQKNFFDQLNPGDLIKVVSPDGKDGALIIFQDVSFHLGRIDQKNAVDYKTQPKRRLWVQVTEGDIKVNGEELATGDGLGLEEVEYLEITSDNKGEFLIIDLK